MIQIPGDYKPYHQLSGSAHSNSLVGAWFSSSRRCGEAPQAGVCWRYATYQRLSANKGYVVSFVAGDPWDSWTSAFAFTRAGKAGWLTPGGRPEPRSGTRAGRVHPCLAARPFLSEIWLGQSRSSRPRPRHVVSRNRRPPRERLSGFAARRQENWRGPIPGFIAGRRWRPMKTACQFVIVARKTRRLVEQLQQAAWKPSPHSDADAESNSSKPQGWACRFLALLRKRTRGRRGRAIPAVCH